MGGQRQQIDILASHIDGQVSRRLHRVSMEQHAPPAAHRPDLPNGLDGPHLVVGKHHRHQTGIRPDGGLDLLRRHPALVPHGQKGHGAALPLQLLQGMQDRVVLKGGRDDMPLPRPLSHSGSGAQRLVIRLAAAGGEGDLPGTGIQAAGHPLPGVAQGFCRFLARPVQTGGVAPALLHTGVHGRQRGRADFCGGGIVRIDFHGVSLLNGKGAARHMRAAPVQLV